MFSCGLFLPPGSRLVFLANFTPFLQAGFTAVGYYPTGSGIPGPSMVYRVAGPDDLRKIGAGYLRVSMASSSDKKTLRDAVKKARQEIEKVEKARKDIQPPDQGC